MYISPSLPVTSTLLCHIFGLFVFSGERSEVDGPRGDRNARDVAGLVHALQDDWSEEGQRIRAGRGWRYDRYTGSPGPVDTSTEVSYDELLDLSPSPTTRHNPVCALPTARCIGYRDVAHPWASVHSPTPAHLHGMLYLQNWRCRLYTIQKTTQNTPFWFRTLA